MKKKHTKKKVNKAKELKKLRNKCWELMSMYTRLKWADSEGFSTCVTCGKRFHYTKLNAGHFIHGTKLRHYKLDYCDYNINPQCVRCNKWLHGNAIQYVTFLTLKYGPEIVNQLQIEGRNKIKLSEAQLLKILDELVDKVEKAKKGEYNVVR